MRTQTLAIEGNHSRPLKSATNSAGRGNKTLVTFFSHFPKFGRIPPFLPALLSPKIRRSPDNDVSFKICSPCTKRSNRQATTCDTCVSTPASPVLGHSCPVCFFEQFTNTTRNFIARRGQSRDSAKHPWKELRRRRAALVRDVWLSLCNMPV
jgi:hypothetical protein